MAVRGAGAGGGGSDEAGVGVISVLVQVLSSTGTISPKLECVYVRMYVDRRSVEQRVCTYIPKMKN